jgi:hypothetical protein
MLRYYAEGPFAGIAQVRVRSVLPAVTSVPGATFQESAARVVRRAPKLVRLGAAVDLWSKRADNREYLIFFEIRLFCSRLMKLYGLLFTHPPVP